jgi:NADH-quinone oxidoreductase subunit H
MIGLLFGAALALIFVGAVGLPALVWLDRRQRGLVAGGVVSQPGERDESGLLALLQPFIEARRGLARPDPIDPAAAPIAARLAPLVSLFAGLGAFAMIPFGGRYAIGHEPTSLVVADPQWGGLGVVVAAAAAGLGVALTGIAGARGESLLGGVRAGVQSMAGVLALTASLLPMWVLFETMQPSAIGAWQDAVIPLVVVPEWWSAGIGLPAWGLIINPLAFAAFVAASLVVIGRPPFDAAFSPTELAGGVLSELSGFRRLAVLVANHVWTLVLAGLGTLVFLGGWSIPWLTQSTLVGAIEPYFGSGFAELLCAVVHVGCFITKLAVMVFAMLSVRWSFPRLRADQVMALCFRLLIPLGLLNAWLTIAVAIALGGEAL